MLISNQNPKASTDGSTGNPIFTNRRASTTSGISASNK